MNEFKFFNGFQTSKRNQLDYELNGITSHFLINLYTEIESFSNKAFIYSVVPRFDEDMNQEIIDIRFQDIDRNVYAAIILENQTYLLLKCIMIMDDENEIDDVIEITQYQSINDRFLDYNLIMNHLRHLANITPLTNILNLTDVTIREIEEDLS